MSSAEHDDIIALIKCCVFLITEDIISCLHVVTSPLYSLAFGIFGWGGGGGGGRFSKNVGAIAELQAAKG
jgi:hypothetical protein